MMKICFTIVLALAQLTSQIVFCSTNSVKNKNEMSYIFIPEETDTSSSEKREFSFLRDECLLEEKPYYEDFAEIKKTDHDLWSNAKQWILENPKKAVALGLVGAWKLKNWLTQENDYFKKREDHNKSPYGKWLDNKKGNWRTLADFSKLVTVGKLSSCSMEVLPTTAYGVREMSGVAANGVTQEPSPSTTDANLNYLYDDEDINTILVLRAQEAGLNLDTTIIMAPLHNDYHQILVHLSEEMNRNNFARDILIPLNLINRDHWVSLFIRLNARNMPTEIIYIDSLGSTIPPSVREALYSVYGAEIKIINKRGLLQKDSSSCGVLVVENLILESLGRLVEQEVDSTRAQKIRDHHIRLADEYSSNLQLRAKQSQEQRAKKHITHSIVLDVDLQSPQEDKDSLARLLYPILGSHWTNLSFEYFNHHILFSEKLKGMRVLVYMNEENEWVGFVALRFYEIASKNKRFFVVNPVTVIMDGYRGKSSTFAWSLFETFKQLCTKPWKNMVMITTLSPYSYHLMAKFIQIMYPSHKQQATPDVEDIARLAAEQLEYKIDSSNPFLVDNSHIPYEMPKGDRERWETRQDQDIVYYIKITGLDPKKAIFTVIPITFKNAISSGYNFIFSRGTSMK